MSLCQFVDLPMIGAIWTWLLPDGAAIFAHFYRLANCS
jgi:hypothetical protein